jgi:hypothetical protein
MDEAFE